MGFVAGIGSSLMPWSANKSLISRRKAVVKSRLAQNRIGNQRAALQVFPQIFFLVVGEAEVCAAVHE